jgi:hypothetical protein
MLGGADLRVAGQIGVQKRANTLTVAGAIWNSEGADGEEGREEDCELHVWFFEVMAL